MWNNKEDVHVLDHLIVSVKNTNIFKFHNTMTDRIALHFWLYLPHFQFLILFQKIGIFDFSLTRFEFRFFDRSGYHNMDATFAGQYPVLQGKTNENSLNESMEVTPLNMYVI